MVVTLGNGKLKKLSKHTKKYNSNSCKRGHAFSVAIIGCGNFGALNDLNSNNKNTALTHLKAYQLLKGFNVVGCVDKDSEKLRRIRCYNAEIKMFNSYGAMFKEIIPDIVSIVTPDETHEKILYDLAKYPIKLVFCEKPLSLSYRSVLAINRLYKKKKIAIQVNYSRRFIKEFGQLKEKIDNNKFGKTRKIVIHYNGGLYHNGSHFIDLLFYLFGEPWKIRAVNSIKSNNKNDYTISGIISYKNSYSFDVVMVGHDTYSRPFSEVEFFFDEGQVRLRMGGSIMEYYKFEKEKYLGGYEELSLIKTIKTEYPHRKIINAIKNIKDYLILGIPLKSPADNSLKVIKLCENLSIQAKLGRKYA
jgi:predicted dehydrogenase